MGMHGNLNDMAVADLIQHYCQERKSARLTILNAGQKAELYFKDGNVDHAVMGDLEGEEVIYQLLTWEDGTFDLAAGVQTKKTTITKSWSALLMEGAWRIDESKIQNDTQEVEQTNLVEEGKMTQKIEELLVDMSGEINGYIASAVVGMDGINIAQHSKTKVDPETISAQMTMLFKMVNSTCEKVDMGVVEDNLMHTADGYVITHFLPGTRQYYLEILTDRKNSSLGNIRLISKIYSERIAKVMPR
jgi:predicted regulator of Ras-like GTPase activity (Roadblock/LC7/MglB family)